MKILQCESHKCQTNPYDDDQTQCLAATHVLGVTGDCRMVPMRLIPDNALVIEKVGEEWQLPPRGWLVLNAAAAFGVPTGSIGLLDELAAALAGERP